MTHRDNVSRLNYEGLSPIFEDTSSAKAFVLGTVYATKSLLEQSSQRFCFRWYKSGEAER